MKANILLRILLLLLAFALPISADEDIPSDSSCNQYPRFIGGTDSSASTIFYHMDVSSDEFAVVGKTNDATIITGGGAVSPFYPYIVVQSIATKENKWTKVFTQRPDEHFSQVAYSSNGQWLVVHGCCSSTSPIYVIYSLNGNIKSSNQYPNSMQDDNNFHRIRTILIDATQNIYIMSQIKVSANTLCQAQNLFKFNANQPLSTLWSLTNIVDCKLFGLKFGRNDNFIYAYGLQNNIPTVSYISNSGSILWNIKQTQCCAAQIIAYFSPSSSSDMIVFTSGTSANILYNIIFSQTSDSFSIDHSKNKQFSHNLDYSSKLIMDFKIIDTDLLRQLVYDFPSKLVNVVKFELDEGQIQIQYLSRLPKFEDSTTVYGQFRQWQNYLVGGDGISMNTNFENTSSFTIPSRTTFVMTSNVNTIACCYKLSSQESESTLSFTSTTGIQTLDTSNFVTSSTDLSSELLTTTNLNTDGFIDFPTFCPQKPSYTIQNINQLTTSFEFNPGVKQTFNIVAPHTFKKNCGPTPKLSYAGHDQSGIPLASGYFIQVNSNTGAITVYSTTPPKTGSFNIQIKATTSAMPDLMTSIDFTLTANAPPYFEPALTDLNVQILKSPPVILTLIDPEGKATNINCQKLNGGSLPTFITCTSSQIKIEPKVMSDRGKTSVKVVVVDDNIKKTSSYTFNVTVYNKAPELQEISPKEVYFDFNKEQIMTLPKIQDPEGLPYFTEILAGPKNFLTLLSNHTLKIYPTNCQTDVGTHLVQISVYDEEPRSITYSFILHIKNLPPFQQKNIPDQKIRLGQKINLPIAEYFKDPEGCTPLMIEFDSIIPPFIIDNQQGEVVFSPSQILQVGSYDLMFKVSDQKGLQKQSNSFQLIVYDAPKFVGPLIKKQFLAVNSISSYPLPVDLSSANQFISNLIMPSFASFKYPVFTFKPETRASIGLSQIQGSLCNPHACLNFQLYFLLESPIPHQSSQELMISSCLLIKSQPIPGSHTTSCLQCLTKRTKKLFL